MLVYKTEEGDNVPRRGENVFRRKDGLWEARYVKEIDAFGKKKYGSVYARSYQEVKNKRQNILDMILIHQKPVITRSITVSQVVKEYLCVNKNRVKLSTYQRYDGYFKNHIDGLVGNRCIIYFTTLSIHEFAMNRLESGLSAQSVNSILVFLHACLKYGQRQYNLPLPEITYLSVEKKEMRVLTLDEQHHLVKYLNQDPDIYKFGVLLALYTGLRIGELCALRWDDVMDGRIKVKRTMQRLRKTDGSGTELIIGTPKTTTSVREIPIPSFLIPFFDQFRKENYDQLYLLGVPGKPITEPRMLQYRFQKYLSAAGICRANFHALRHTFATRCVECGFEIKSLTEILGHANVQITLNRYVHSSFELKCDNMEKLKQTL